MKDASAPALTPVYIARCAVAEFERRRTRARDMVANRALTATAANDLLRPWLAIACVAGADLPELDESLAERRDIRTTDDLPFLREGEARALVADDICPRPRWRAELAKLRDAALAQANANPAALERAMELCLLAKALIPDIAPASPAGAATPDNWRTAA